MRSSWTAWPARSPTSTGCASCSARFEFRRPAGRSGTPAGNFPWMTKRPRTGRYEVVRTADQLQHVLDQIPGGQDLLPGYRDDRRPQSRSMPELVGVALSVREEHAWYVPVGHNGRRRRVPSLPRPDRAGRPAQPVWGRVALSLHRPETSNTTFWSWPNTGCGPAGWPATPCWPSYLLDPATRHNLNDLAWEHLHYSMTSYEESDRRGQKGLCRGGG